MQRLRLYDLRVGRLPGLIGLCAADLNKIAQAVNSAQRRLLYAKECSDEGWWGTFAEVQFQASRATPYVTMSREIARIEVLDVCNRPTPLNNQFKEYLQFGNGRMPKQFPWNQWTRYTQGYTRNNAVTFVDPAPAPSPFLVKIFMTNPADATGPKRVLVQGLDATNSVIYTQDGPNNTNGQFVPLAQPFALAPIEMTAILGIQKDITVGAIQIFQTDPNGVIPDLLLLTMEPVETTASYRRYYLDHLPCWGCCPLVNAVCQAQVPPVPVTVNAIVKLDLIPVTVDTDYCLIQNEEAIIMECQSLRMSKMDTVTAVGKASEYHQEAIRLLIGELTHYLGKNTPAVNFAPFGTARLERLRIGMK